MRRDPLWRRAAGLAVAAALVGAIAACEDERAIATEPVGPPAYGVGLAVAPNVPAGPVRFVFPRRAADSAVVQDTVRWTLSGLDSLETGHYTIWLGNAEGTAFKRAPSRLRIVRVDTAIDAQGEPVITVDTVDRGVVSSFQNGGMGRRLEFVTTRAIAGFAPADPMRLLLITIEDSPTAASPTGRRRPVWASRQARATASDTGTATADTARAAFKQVAANFGRWHEQAESLYVYVPTGRGRAIWRGDVMILNDSSLTRPPLGYFYAAWLVQRDTLGQLHDTLYLGPLATPFPERVSLRDADSVIVDPRYVTVIPPAITAASNRLQVDTVSMLVANEAARGAPWAWFAQVLITLELKNNEAAPEKMGPAIVLRADIPGVIRFSGTR